MRLKQLPLGISSFADIIARNCVYIDKTQYIYNLISEGKYYFLSRPRRFGKSLLVSTLREIFFGNKELFKTLWIDKSDYSWRKHPIIWLDFGIIARSDAASLKKSISSNLREIAREYSIDISHEETIEDLLRSLIKQLARTAPIVVLIDEYDKPILDNIGNIQEANAQRAVLQGLYSVIKGLDRYIHFLLITGVTKFAHTSLFSGLNNLTDITLNTHYATMLGYTQNEVKTHLGPHLEKAAQINQLSVKSLLHKLHEFYDGYRFAPNSQAVFNPYSVMRCLSDGTFKGHWFGTGTPTFLVELFKTHSYELTDIEHPQMTENDLGAFDIESIELTSLLFQTGYLTIKSYDTQNHLYTLDFPNKEVSQAMNLVVASSLTNLKDAQVQVHAQTIARALNNDDFDAFQGTLQDLFNKMPYTTHVKCERDLQFILYAACKLAGIDVVPEVATSIGRTDLIINVAKRVYIIELKVDQTPHKALEQINNRRYYEKYLACGKDIILVGINFDTKQKTITLVTSQI